MLRVAAVAVVLLVACETQPHLPLGAWSSDRALTLASLSQAPTLTRSYQAALADPTLFGRNIQVFTPSGAVVWFEGECGEFTPFEVIESRLSHLAYGPEIASAMLRRQQAGAVVAARTRIVEGAVGMVEMALARIEKGDMVTLDEEKKAAMVSNLLVVLCSEQAASPVINAGTLHN